MSVLQWHRLERFGEHVEGISGSSSGSYHDRTEDSDAGGKPKERVVAGAKQRGRPKKTEVKPMTRMDAAAEIATAIDTVGVKEGQLPTYDMTKPAIFQMPEKFLLTSALEAMDAQFRKFKGSTDYNTSGRSHKKLPDAMKSAATAIFEHIVPVGHAIAADIDHAHSCVPEEQCKHAARYDVKSRVEILLGP